MIFYYNLPNTKERNAELTFRKTRNTEVTFKSAERWCRKRAERFCGMRDRLIQSRNEELSKTCGMRVLNSKI